MDWVLDCPKPWNTSGFLNFFCDWEFSWYPSFISQKKLLVKQTLEKETFATY